MRLAILLALLAIVFAAAEAWRRGVLRYVHEPRRRYQLLLVRRIVFWALVVAIVGFTFATELGSLATFAGLITAGVAVAMQSVLVSIVGYFFLIGKYGIRVGDRVQIGTVTGEVIDLGLVRLHLMELSGQGPLGPTGRVVAFANSIVFQASGGIFKQIPGVNLAWHDITLTLPSKADPSAMKEKLLAAANHVLGEYSEDMARQTREIQKTTSLHAGGEATGPGAAALLRLRRRGARALSRAAAARRGNRRAHIPRAAEGDYGRCRVSKPAPPPMEKSTKSICALVPGAIGLLLSMSAAAQGLVASRQPASIIDSSMEPTMMRVVPYPDEMYSRAGAGAAVPYASCYRIGRCSAHDLYRFRDRPNRLTRLAPEAPPESVIRPLSIEYVWVLVPVTPEENILPKYRTASQVRDEYRAVGKPIDGPN